VTRWVISVTPWYKSKASVVLGALLIGASTFTYYSWKKERENKKLEAARRLIEADDERKSKKRKMKLLVGGLVVGAAAVYIYDWKRSRERTTVGAKK